MLASLSWSPRALPIDERVVRFCHPAGEGDLLKVKLASSPLLRRRSRSVLALPQVEFTRRIRRAPEAT